MRDKKGKFTHGNLFGHHTNHHLAGLPKTFTKEYIDSLVPDLIEWAKKDDSIVFNEWIATRGFYQQRMSEFCAASPYFEENFRAAKLLVAMRRERLALLGKVSESIVKHTMHVYDKELFDSMIALKKAGISTDQMSKVEVILTGRNIQHNNAKSKRKKKA